MPAPPVVICPIRYDAGVRTEDHKLWMQLRRLFANSPTQLLGFVSVSTATYWMDQFNPLLLAPEHASANRDIADGARSATL